jgi:hypothetical protein
MKKSNARRFRRSTSSRDLGKSKEGKEQKFFGSEGHDPFFQPTASIQRAGDTERKEEKINRAADEKEKEKDKVQRAAEPEKKEEEKVHRAAEPEKKEEEKVKRQPEKKEEEKIHKKESDASPGSGVTAAEYIDSIDSKGQPMPEKEQSFFGKKMGYDFSTVRVHTGRDAAESARDVSAKAYTYGRHIVFNDGQYNTESQEGRTLIAHELTHVVQQGATPTYATSAGSVHGAAARQVQRGFWGDVWDVVSGAASAAWSGVKSVAGWGWDVVKSAGAWVWDVVTWFPSRVWAMLKHFGSGIVGIMSWLWSGLTGALGHIWDGLKGALSWIEDGVEGLFSWIWRGLQGGAQWAWKLLHGDFSGFWDGFADAFSWLGSGVSGLLSWGWKGLEGVVTWAWKGIGGLAKWIWDGVQGGLAWIGRFVAKLLDIIGAGELWTLLMNILKGWSTRTMTSVEITEARKVFDASISYWQVRIDEMSLIAKIGAFFSGGGGMGVTTAHTINFNKKISAAAGNADMVWLMHELGHVAQYTHVGLQYMGEAIHAQATAGYNYGGGAALAGKDLKDFNREQQAEILSHYYRDVLYGHSAYAPDYARLRNEAVHGDF